MELQWHLLVGAAVAGYVCGSVSFARVIGRIVAPGEDLSGSEVVVGESQRRFRFDLAGGTNVAHRLGARFGLLTSLLDLLKVFLPSLAFRLLYPELPYFLAAAAFGVVGHNWPVFHRFKGGAGLSSTLGGLLVVDWLAVIVAPAAGMILGLAVFRDVFVAGSLWVFLLIPWLWLRSGSFWHVVYAVVVSLSFLLASLPTFRRYLRLKREDPQAYEELITASHMSRGLLRIGRLFGMRGARSGGPPAGGPPGEGPPAGEPPEGGPPAR
ncbi:MAG: glycerol-3-phosphate acyltransferase [Spirochaetales bacterium]|nr:glycerol-3-phosphate acyltransferase [Spirochaetales bacterium]